MIDVSTSFNEAFKRTKREELLFKVTINDVVYDKTRIFNSECEYGIATDEGLFLGTTFSNSLKVVFSEVITVFSELDEVVAEMGIRLPDGSVEYCPLGTFVISERVDVNRNDMTTSIFCLDNMALMEGTYESSLSYPAPIRDVALEIANKAGMTVNATNFSRLSTNTIKKIEGATYRQAIGMIAQLEAGYALFNRQGELEIRTLNNTEFEISPDHYRSKGLVKNDLQYRLGGISVDVDDESTLQIGSTQGSQISLENSVMTQQLLSNVYSKIENINFYPFTLEWWGNPALEVGDWVLITDLEGNEFKAPLLSYKLTFDGGISSTLSADVETTSNHVTTYKPPLKQKLEKLGQFIVNNRGEITFFGLDPPAAAKEGDRWMKPEGPDEVLYIYTDGDWVRIVGTGDVDVVKDQIDEAIAEIEDVKTDIDDRLLLVNQEIANNFTSLSDSISDVNDIANQAKEDAIGALGIVNNVNMTVNQLNGEVGTLITRVDGNDVLINQVKSTADGTVQTVANHAGRLTTVETNVSGLQVSVADKVSNAQFTVLSNAVASKVTSSDVTSILNADKNIKDTRNDNQSPKWYFDNYPRQVVREFKDRTVLGVNTTGVFGVLVTEVPWHDPTGGRIQQTFYGESATFTRNGTGTTSGTWDVWVQVADRTYVSSQITQLSDQINLRVTKGDVMSQINIEAGRTLISSNKLYLDANTVTFSGSAFIPSAAISSINADKITTGTLNAANVNIINLNASNITTGRLNGLELYGGYINGGRITSTGTVGELAINSASLTVYNDKVVNGQIQRAVVALSNTQQDFPGLRIWHGIVDSAGIYTESFGSTNITPEDGIQTTRPIRVGNMALEGYSNYIKTYTSDMVYVVNSINDRWDLGVRYLNASVRIQAGKISIVGSDLVHMGNSTINFMRTDGTRTNIAANMIESTGMRIGAGGTLYLLNSDMLHIANTNDDLRDLRVRHLSARDRVTGGNLSLYNNDIVHNGNADIHFTGANGLRMNIHAARISSGNQVMSTGNTYYALNGNTLYFADRNDQRIDIGVRTVLQSSEYRLKENFEMIGEYDVLHEILKTDVVKYHFKGNDEPRLGLIIGGGYQTSGLFVAKDGRSKKDSDIIGALMLSVKYLHNAQQICEGKYINEIGQLKSSVNSDILRINTFVSQHELEIRQLKQKIEELERKLV